MLKYHVQTSGRSLHAQEISFNDIRTTLQALYALFDNCNSLHTNAFDEAITTPTEQSVRRAVAIQMIISRELGLNFCENPWQGSFVIDELTDLVEEAVYQEFERISERGGVLGAMDTMYQRGKIQEESLYYESKKHDGSLPLIGVNTFLPKEGQEDEVHELELIRSTEHEKTDQIRHVRAFQSNHEDECSARARRLQVVARERDNIFAELMETVKSRVHWARFRLRCTRSAASTVATCNDRSGTNNERYRQVRSAATQVALLTLNRPDSMNGFTSQLSDDLLEALEKAHHDDDIRVVVLTGEGRCFSAGADLKSGFEGRRVFGKLQYEYRPVMSAIATMPKPVIAAVPGSAAGIGFSLALTLRLADHGGQCVPAVAIHDNLTRSRRRPQLAAGSAARVSAGVPAQC